MVKLSDYFNSTTGTGRANVAKATYATIALLFIYARFIRKKTPKEPKTPEVAAALPSQSQTPSEESTAPKAELVCPKCQCGCQCQFISESESNTGTQENLQKTANTTETKPAQGEQPAPLVFTNNGQNTNEAAKATESVKTTETVKTAETKIPTSKILKDVDIREVLTYEKDDSFTELDPW